MSFGDWCGNSSQVRVTGKAQDSVLPGIDRDDGITCLHEIACHLVAWSLGLRGKSDHGYGFGILEDPADYCCLFSCQDHRSNSGLFLRYSITY